MNNAAPIARIIVASLTIIAAGLVLPDASAQSESESQDGSETPVRHVSSKYVNESLGLEIDLPEGWEGFEAEFEPSKDFPIDMTVFATAPNPTTPLPEGSDYADYVGIMMIFSGDIASILSWAEEENPFDEVCGMPEYARITTIGEEGNIKAFEVIDECNFEPGILKMKSYVIGVREHKVVYFTLTAVSNAGYDRFVEELDKSVGTLKVLAPLDLSELESYASTGEYETTVLEANVEGTTYELEAVTNSAIPEFSLDEEGRTVTFKVEGEDGTRGATLFEIGKVLEPPYVVSVDGQPVERSFMVIRDETINRTSISVAYDHSVHEISIRGANVVPEFPIGAIIIISGMLGVVALVTRTALWKSVF